VGDGSLLVVEIRRRSLTRVWPSGKKDIVANLGGGPNGCAIGPDGYAYVCNNGGFAFRQHAGRQVGERGHAGRLRDGPHRASDIETGKFEVLYDKVGDMPIRGPNDIVFDAHGGFWFTDPGKTRHRDWDRGSICYARADGSMIKEMVFPIVKPNGIGLSPDGKTLYCAETESSAAVGVGPEGSRRIRQSAAPSPRRRTAAASSTRRRSTSVSTRSPSRRTATSASARSSAAASRCARRGRHRGVRAGARRHALHQHLLRRTRLRKAYITQSYVGQLSRWTGRVPACAERSPAGARDGRRLRRGQPQRRALV
jgi:gluconolactonase